MNGEKAMSEHCHFIAYKSNESPCLTAFLLECVRSYVVASVSGICNCAHFPFYGVEGTGNKSPIENDRFALFQAEPPERSRNVGLATVRAEIKGDSERNRVCRNLAVNSKRMMALLVCCCRLFIYFLHTKKKIENIKFKRSLASSNCIPQSYVF